MLKESPRGKRSRRVIGMVVERAIQLIMKSHLYKFAGIMYRQARGLPIGSRLTGSIARISTDRWSRQMNMVMEDNLVKSYLKKKYVDDINLITESVGMGTRWHDGTLRWRQEWEDEDVQQEKTHDIVTLQALVDMGNSIDPQIQFTGQCADDNKDGRVPMQDLHVWRSREGEREVLRHSYYEKPITSKKMMMEKSAHPMRSKMAVLSQEVIRRMRNTSLKLPMSERIRILDQMMIKLRASGYNESQRYEILYSGMLGYCRRS